MGQILREVSTIRRVISLELTPAEATALLGDFNLQKEPSTEGKQLYGALCAIRDGREYGGN